MSPVIRPFDPDRHRSGFNECVRQLQEHELTIDPRMRSSKELVPGYLEHLLPQCDKFEGQILVALSAGQVAGYTCVLTRVPTEDPDDGDYEYALVTDIVVTRNARGNGLGKALLDAAEQVARKSHARWLRISVLARNQPAYRLYESHGFKPLYIDLEKAL